MRELALTLASPRRRMIIRADGARDRRDLIQAVILYRSIIERWGATFGLLMQLGNALKDSAAFSEAEETYQAALVMNPESADCHLQIGHLMKLSGRPDEAEKFYVEANRLEPDLPGAIEELRIIRERDKEAASATLAAHSELRDEDHTAQAGTRSTDRDYDLGAETSVIYRRLTHKLQWRRD